MGLLFSAVLMMGTLHGYQIAKTKLCLNKETAAFLDIGRTAFLYWTRDIQASGYRGCRTRDITFPIAALYSEYNRAYSYFRFDQPLFGFSATLANCYGKMPASACGRVREGTDVLIVYNVPQKMNRLARRLERPEELLETREPHHIQKDSLVLVSDCQQGDLFIANDVDSTQIRHDRILGTNKTNRLSKAYDQDAEVVELQTVAYYIGTPERFLEHNRMDMRPQFALFRDDFLHSAQEIISEVADLQVEYGLRGGTDSKRLYKKTNEMRAQDWPFVVSLRLTLIAHNKRLWKYEISPRNVAWIPQAFM